MSFAASPNQRQKLLPGRASAVYESSSKVDYAKH